MKSPATALEIRYRPVDSEGLGDMPWTYRRYPVGERISLPKLARGDQYEVEARNHGVRGVQPSAWVAATVTIADTATVPPSQRAAELTIAGNAITLDGAFRSFRLTLSEDVSSVAFTNIPQVAELVIEIEQWGAGGNSIAWPANVVPVSGVPHAMSSAAGAVDIVSLRTTNGGVTWYQTVFQAGVAFAGTISPSPASDTAATDGVTPSAPTVAVAMTTANGTAPVTHAWTRDDSGGTNFLIDDATSDAPTFTIPADTTAYTATQRWRDTATDAAGLVCQATVNVTLSRAVAGGLSVSVSPDPAYGSVFVDGSTNERAQVTMTVTPSGVTGTAAYSCERIDANGGANFLTVVPNTASPTLRGQRGSTPLLEEQTWRFSVTDDVATAFADVVVTLERI